MYQASHRFNPIGKHRTQRTQKATQHRAVKRRDSRLRRRTALPVVGIVLAGGGAVSAMSAMAGVSDAAAQCNAMTSNVYQLMNPSTHATLLTTSAREASQADQFGFTENLGVQFKVSSVSNQNLTAVVRLYKNAPNDFLWTRYSAEVKSAVANNGYTSAGTSFYAADSASSCNSAVYRLRKSGVHRYASSAAQRDSLEAAGWTYENVAFYAVAAASNGAPTSSSSSPSGAPSTQPASGPSSRPISSPASSSSQPPSSANPSGSPKPTTQPSSSTPPPSTRPPGSWGGGPLSRPLYTFASGNAYNAYKNATDPATKRGLYQIAGTPGSLWLGGASTDASRVNTIETDAVAHGKTPVFVLYAIPNRDCGHYSAGGVSTVAQYESWVDSIHTAIDNRPAVLIIEPDAVGMGCLNADQKADRIAMLRYDITKFRDSNVWTYIHAGSAGQDASHMATVLQHVDVGDARGFAVNVSSFDSTASEIAYGESLDKALGMQKHFVIDTSRNGNGRYTGNDGAPNWCNPPGRALGSRPTTDTADALVDAYLWIKVPGGSDGACRAGDPPAGHWYQSYALDLVQRAIDGRIISTLGLPA